MDKFNNLLRVPVECQFEVAVGSAHGVVNRVLLRVVVQREQHLAVGVADVYPVGVAFVLQRLSGNAAGAL